MARALQTLVGSTIEKCEAAPHDERGPREAENRPYRQDPDGEHR